MVARVVLWIFRIFIHYASKSALISFVGIPLRPILNSVEKPFQTEDEASSDIAAAKKQKQSTTTKLSEEPDIEQLVENKRKQTILEE